MKRRFAAILLLFTLLATLWTLPASADGQIFFVAVNDTVPLTLNADTAPFYANGILYVPHTAFTVSGLGITPSYNVAGQTLTLFSRSQRLVFDLPTGVVSDETGTSYLGLSYAIRAGMVYLPAEYCVAHFGLTVSLLQSSAGYPVLRFKTGAEVYDDALFIQKAENLIAYRAQQYGAQPALPSVTPTPSEPGTEPTWADAPLKVYLAVTEAGSMGAALTMLRQQGCLATFFLTGQEILENPTLVYAIRAAGLPVGLTVSPGDDPASALAEANEALHALIGSKSLLALLSPEQAIQAKGYFCVSRNDAVPAEEITSGTEGSYLLLCEQNCASTLLTLRGTGCTFRPIRETTVFDTIH